MLKKTTILKETEKVKINQDFLYNNKRAKKIVKMCKKCCNNRLTVKVEQEKGKRDVKEDVCPYCGYSNESSMIWDFMSFKIK